MSDEETDDSGAETPEEEASEEEDEEVTVESLRERLDAISERLEAAETEDDLDEVEDDVEALESDLETLPEPDEDEEEPPAEELEGDLEDLRADLEEERGPYAEDVAEVLSEVGTTIEETRWTEAGEAELAEAIATFVHRADEILADADLGDVEGDAHPDTLAAVKDVLERSALDPDEDAAVIADLLEAAETLSDAVEDAEEWDDLTVREKLAAEGFYDVLDHRKDYPPEWHAIKVYEKRNEPEPILRALEMFDSEFMEEHCLDALGRLGAEEALDEMRQRAQRRDEDAIEIMGTIGSEEPVETLLEYAGEESDPGLQKVSLKALGEIGSEEATQTVADQLAVENDSVRSRAARTLGLIGDTRAIDPLTDVLADDDADPVRASAAWALNQIGTERALEAVAEYADDPAYIVQAEAEKAV